jgi:hypothetical protein
MEGAYKPGQFRIKSIKSLLTCASFLIQLWRIGSNVRRAFLAASHDHIWSWIIFSSNSIMMDWLQCKARLPSCFALSYLILDHLFIWPFFEEFFLIELFLTKSSFAKPSFYAYSSKCSSFVCLKKKVVALQKDFTKDIMLNQSESFLARVQCWCSR